MKCNFVVLNCPKFGHLIVTKIVRIVATRCQIWGVIYTKFNLGWGCAPDPVSGAYSTPLLGELRVLP